ncbi:hypothetical protein ACSYAO_002226 [Stenotrophomonas sp. STK16_22]|uniref:hypothetical protein n=1 Tax=Stenotrophomonas TaxID=40323 RepID=UPI00122FECEF|nr:hypothetical protein [Stenotrophomonas maltophilia]MBH1818211.1 hypothetical protein [Stenotrophomonas maltophilia]MCU1029544.1 hypothetical protein [Stenotrophomonas maltophilia]
MNRSRTTLGLALCLAITPVLAAGSNCRTTYWTPETIGFKEQLPNTSTPPGVGCMLTEFSVNDRNWMDKIRLPHAFGPLDIINNAASSEKTLEIHDSISGVPGKPLKLAAGRAISFLSRKSGQSVYTWDSSSQSPPNTSRWQIPRNSQLISIIDLRNGKHAGELILPSVGKAFDTITIENNATSATKVLGTHTPFPGQRMDVASGEAVRAEFDPFARRWMWVHAPYREKKVKDRYHRVASRTVMELQDGEWASPVTPPSVAHDRDRIILRSSATWDSEIKVNKGDPASKHLPLRRGDEYEFVFVAEQNRWHLLRQSIRPVDTTNQKEVRLKDEGYDVIEVNAPVSAPITPNVILPKPRQGLRVIAVGHPVMTMNIIADNLNVPVLQNEKIAFRVNDRGLWERETTTIDLLWVLDRSAGEFLYRWDALVLMRENIRRANEALENSGATFRYRLVGNPIEGFTYPGVDLKDVPADLARDRNLQALLKQHRADGIYYGGSNRWTKSEVCDWADYSYTEKSFVIATALTCPTSAFSRRAGFALGLPDNSVSKPVPVIGSGDQLPFYPTPHRMLPDGRWAFNPGQETVLDNMNSRAKSVARFSDKW